MSPLTMKFSVGSSHPEIIGLPTGIGLCIFMSVQNIDTLNLGGLGVS